MEYCSGSGAWGARWRRPAVTETTETDSVRAAISVFLADDNLIVREGVRSLLSLARAVLPTTVDADGVDRYEQDVEAAVYFCVLEALQNAGKHAGEEGTISVVVEALDDELRFGVTDDGAGFDLDEGHRGHGFVNMADRLGAIGGSVAVWSEPGRGTRITGRIPAAAPRET